MDLKDSGILTKIEDTIRLQKNIKPNPFFYTRVMQRIENGREVDSGSFSSYLRYLVRPIPVSIIIIIGIAFGIIMVDFSSWASYHETQQSLVANEEAFNAYYQGNVDQSVYEAYYSPETTYKHEPDSK